MNTYTRRPPSYNRDVSEDGGSLAATSVFTTVVLVAVGAAAGAVLLWFLARRCSTGGATDAATSRTDPDAGIRGMDDLEEAVSKQRQRGSAAAISAVRQYSFAELQEAAKQHTQGDGVSQEQESTGKHKRRHSQRQRAPKGVTV